MDDSLCLMHARLTRQFSELRDSRVPLGRPIYLFEHGLESDELVTLTNDVQRALEVCPFDNCIWWQQRFLPLLVIACEVGYDYQGNGTDYWPILEGCLGVQFSYEQRQRLTNYFQTCQTTLGCVRPPETDWARSFCHIAWPITNAVLPLDMRLPFAQALCQVSCRILSETDDATILRMISSASVDNRSRRFDSWARTERLVADLARDFLNDGYSVAYLDSQTRDRVLRDLHQDSTVRRQLRLARQRQRRAQVSGSRGTSAAESDLAEKVLTPKGRLFLSRKSGTSFVLEGETPPLPQHLRNCLSMLLRSGQWRVQPWGLKDTAPLSPSVLLHGTRFVVPLRHLSQITAGQPFLAGMENLSLQPSDREFLVRLKFDLHLPLVFSPDDDGFATQRLNRRLMAGEVAWVV